jgi:hypothetical protein
VRAHSARARSEINIGRAKARFLVVGVRTPCLGRRTLAYPPDPDSSVRWRNPAAGSRSLFATTRTSSVSRLSRPLWSSHPGGPHALPLGHLRAAYRMGQRPAASPGQRAVGNRPAIDRRPASWHRLRIAGGRRGFTVLVIAKHDAAHREAGAAKFHGVQSRPEVDDRDYLSPGSGGRVPAGPAAEEKILLGGRSTG